MFTLHNINVSHVRIIDIKAGNHHNTVLRLM